MWCAVTPPGSHQFATFQNNLTQKGCNRSKFNHYLLYNNDPTNTACSHDYVMFAKYIVKKVKAIINYLKKIKLTNHGSMST